jgi:hypothetical protein
VTQRDDLKESNMSGIDPHAGDLGALPASLGLCGNKTPRLNIKTERTGSNG